MCGIIGVSGVPDAARLAYLGLYSLQQRGQESAGIVAVDGAGVARSHRGMGLVSDIFAEPVLAGLAGDVAVGHTRYSTAGSSVLANAQPMLAGYREGPLALAHNGNLTNAVQLRADLVTKGSIFQSSSDSEVLVHLIARSEAREPEAEILDALERVEGAYSLVITIGRTLYAMVDGRGFRPLVLGRLGGGRGWVVASETCALDIIGATPYREVEPGEFLRLHGDELDELPRLPPKPLHRCVFELVYFSRPDSTVFHRSVDRVRRALRAGPWRGGSAGRGRRKCIPASRRRPPPGPATTGSTRPPGASSSARATRSSRSASTWPSTRSATSPSRACCGRRGASPRSSATHASRATTPRRSPTTWSGRATPRRSSPPSPPDPPCRRSSGGSTFSAPVAPTAPPRCATSWAARAPASPRWRTSASPFRPASRSPPSCASPTSSAARFLTG